MDKNNTTLPSGGCRGDDCGPRLAVLETKLDRLQEDVSELRADSKVNTASLAEHIKRTELAEARIEQVRKQNLMFIGIMFIMWIISNGGVDSATKLMPILLKLFGG